SDTLNQPVPPMMLQTLVENAIKHGINKQEHGGFITVRSVFVNNHHELLVINSGIYQSKIDKSETGFGIKSTQDRLNLLYQGKANFEIHDMKDNTVQSKIIIPITEIL
ncbi:MAG: sensor histidine kinase, partial [Ferruginibacter sp.]